jgi:hypothetical protein
MGRSCLEKKRAVLLANRYLRKRRTSPTSSSGTTRIGSPPLLYVRNDFTVTQKILETK